MDLNDNKFKILYGGRNTTAAHRLDNAINLYQYIKSLDNDVKYTLVKNEIGVIIYKEEENVKRKKSR